MSSWRPPAFCMQNYFLSARAIQKTAITGPILNGMLVSIMGKGSGVWATVTEDYPTGPLSACDTPLKLHKLTWEIQRIWTA
jgi:hypothetical protein